MAPRVKSNKLTNTPQ